MNGRKIVIVCGALILSMAGVAAAHPSTSITVRYDQATSLLSIEAAHAVKDETVHYIGTVVVQKDGKAIITQNFARQTNKQYQQAVYMVPGLTAGDQIAVTTTCNKYGTQTVKVTVE